MCRSHRDADRGQQRDEPQVTEGNEVTALRPSYADVVNPDARGGRKEPAVSKRMKRATTTQRSVQDSTQVILPLMFAGMKAIIRTFPGAALLQQIRALLAAEELLVAVHATIGR